MAKTRPSSSHDLLSGTTIKIALLGLTAIWQVYTMGRLGAYGGHLLESRDRHDELQRALSDAQNALTSLRNNTNLCEVQAQEHAAKLETAESERKTLEFKIEELQDLNSWLNSTAAARETALRVEQSKRLTLEGSVQSLK